MHTLKPLPGTVIKVFVADRLEPFTFADTYSARFSEDGLLFITEGEGLDQGTVRTFSPWYWQSVETKRDWAEDAAAGGPSHA